MAVFRYNAICPKGRALLWVLLSAERGEWTEGGDRPLCARVLVLVLTVAADTMGVDVSRG